MRVIYSNQALIDLEDISEYISRDNPDAAIALVAEVLEKCEVLANHPKMGGDRSYLRKGLRGFSIGNYVIFYESLPEGIHLVRVIHGARDLPSLFD